MNEDDQHHDGNGSTGLSGGRNFAEMIDRLGALVPGYSGYRDRQSSRVDEREIRSVVSSRLEFCQRLVRTYQVQLLEEEGIESLSVSSKVDREIGKLVSKWRTAPSFYTSFMGKQTLKDGHSLNLISIDLECLNTAEELAVYLEAKEGPNPPPFEPILSVLKQVDLLFVQRAELLNFGVRE